MKVVARCRARLRRLEPIEICPELLIPLLMFRARPFDGLVLLLELSVLLRQFGELGLEAANPFQAALFRIGKPALEALNVDTESIPLDPELVRLLLEPIAFGLNERRALGERRSSCFGLIQGTLPVEGQAVLLVAG